MPFLYDLNLKRFSYEHGLGQYGFEQDQVYCADDGECRLGRYLGTEGWIQAFVGNGNRLADISDNNVEDLGEIVGVLPYLGYWIVTQNGKVDIFRGQNSIRPVRFES